MTGKLAVVFGGSGFVGRHVVRELAKRGWRIRVAVRRPHLAQFLRPMGAVGQIQLAQANIRNEGSVARVLENADAVINLIGILHQEGAQKFSTVQSIGAMRLAELCKERGIEDFVHMSAIGANADSDIDYVKTKGEAEAAVRAAIPDAVILRPSIIIGQEDNFFNKFASMATLTPVTPLPLIGGGATRFQPVYVDDVADAVAASLENSEAKGKTYELGGPQIYTFKELMQRMLAEIDRPRPLIPIPFFAASLIGKVGEIAGALPFVEPPLTSGQVEMLKSDNIVDSSGTVGVIEDLGIKPQTLDCVLPTYMAPYRKYGQFAERPA